MHENFTDVKIYRSFFTDRVKNVLKNENSNQIGIRSGINPSKIRKWATGTTSGIAEAAVFADATGISLDWLVGREGAVREFPPPIIQSVDGEPTTLAAEMPPPPLTKMVLSEDTPFTALDVQVYRSDGKTNQKIRFEIINHFNRWTSEDLIAVADNRLGVCICHRTAIPNDGVWVLRPANDAIPVFRRAVRKMTGDFVIQPIRFFVSMDVPPEQVTPTDFADMAVGRVIHAHESVFI